ncbi:MAG: hypothetical protein R3D68_10715 [Hyphomicrobiaceae bacterium]
MRIKTLMVGLGLALALPLPALAQRGGPPGFAANWELLGEERVGLGKDSDVINLRHNEGYYRDRSYRRLRFVVSGGEVQMRTVRLVYLNGHTEELQINRNLHSGENVDVDLRGERSYLARIQMFYKGKFGFSLGGGGLRINQATVKVFGENVRHAPPPPPPPVHRPPVASLPPGWSVAATVRFDRADNRVVIPIGRNAGGFSKIRLQQSGDAIAVHSLAVTYGNGEVQNIAVNQRLANGEATRPFDLSGNRRFIERIVVNLDPRRRPGAAGLAVQGDAGPGPGGGPGHGGRADWVPLGKQSVGFGVDRDVIRVGQSEDFYRNRGFDKLHFVAENNEVFMRSIRVVYMNGYTEDYNVERMIPAGRDLAVDLRGRRSYIREIEMTYRARRGFNGRAVVSVFGEPPRRR